MTTDRDPPPERLTRWFDQRVAAHKVPRITFHGLRHSYVTMFRGDQPVRAVSARVGHASANVTNAIYSHVLPGDDEQAALAGAALRRVAGSRSPVSWKLAFRDTESHGLGPGRASPQ